MMTIELFVVIVFAVAGWGLAIAEAVILERLSRNRDQLEEAWIEATRQRDSMAATLRTVKDAVGKAGER